MKSGQGFTFKADKEEQSSILSPDKNQATPATPHLTRQAQSLSPETALIQYHQEQLQLRRLILAMTENEKSPYLTALETLYQESQKLGKKTRMQTLAILEKSSPAESLLVEPDNFFKLSTAPLDKPSAKKTSIMSSFFSGQTTTASNQKDTGIIDEKAPIFAKINEVIQLLETLLNTLQEKPEKQSKYVKLFQALQALLQYYQAFRTQLRIAKPEERAVLMRGKPFLISVEFGAHYLKPEIADKIFPVNPDGSIARTNTVGSHTVTPAGGVYFKINPHAPAIEFAVDSLNKCLTGQGSTPTCLIKIYRQGIMLPVLASKAVPGQSLLEILEQDPLMEKHLVDPGNFAASVTTSFITKSQDGKPENSISESLESKPELVITNIDQDMNFADVITRSADKKYHIVQLRNILLFFPQMQQKIPDGFRQHLAKQSAVLTMLDWLKKLWIKNQSYKTLRTRRLLTLGEKQALQLPLHFVPEEVSKAYQLLEDLIAQYRSPKELTLQDLFSKTYPLVCHLYKLCLVKTNGNILKAYALLTFSTVEELLALDPNQEQVAYWQKQLLAYEAGPWDFEDKRTQTVSEALQLFLTQIDCQNLDPDQQYQFLEQLLTFPELNQLYLKNCAAITDDHLQRFAENGTALRQITLIQCPNVSEAGIAWLALYRPQIVLEISQTDLVGATQWPTNGNDFDQFTLILRDNHLLTVKAGQNLLTAPDLIHNAVKMGSVEGVQFLLANGVKCTQRDASKCTALMYAAKAGHSSLILLLLEDSLDLQDKLGKTALHWAAEEKQFAVIIELLQQGAQTNLLTAKGESFLHLAVQSLTVQQLKEISEILGENQIKALIRIIDNAGKTILHHAAINADAEVMQYLLGLALIDPNVKDNNGYTPLHFAARDGWLTTVQILIEAGAQPSATTKGGVSPLKLAKDNQRQAVITFLESENNRLSHTTSAVADKQAVDALQQAATQLLITGDLDAFAKALKQHQQAVLLPDSNGDTVLHHIARGPDSIRENYESQDQAEQTRLEQACVAAINLLVKQRARPNLRNQWGEIPLHLAISASRSIAIIQALLKLDSTLLTAVTIDNKNVLHMATSAIKNQLIIIQFLMKSGAEPLLNIPDIHGQYPLHHIIGKRAYPDQIATLKYLLTLNVSLSIRNYAYETLLHAHIAKGDALIEITQILLAKLALFPINAQDLDGNTPLHKAIMTAKAENNYNQDMISALMQAGADSDAPNNEGQTPLALVQNHAILKPLIENALAFKPLTTPKTDKENFALQQDIKRILHSEYWFPKAYERTIEPFHLKVIEKRTQQSWAKHYEELRQRYQFIYQGIFKPNTVLEPLSATIVSTDIKKMKIAMEWIISEKAKVARQLQAGDGKLSLEVLKAQVMLQALTDHFAFCEQIFKRAYDVGLTQRRLSALQAHYQARGEIISHQLIEKLTQEKSLFTAATPAAQVKQNYESVLVQLLITLDELIVQPSSDNNRAKTAFDDLRRRINGELALMKVESNEQVLQAKQEEFEQLLLQLLNSPQPLEIIQTASNSETTTQVTAIGLQQYSLLQSNVKKSTATEKSLAQILNKYNSLALCVSVDKISQTIIIQFTSDTRAIYEDSNQTLNALRKDILAFDRNLTAKVVKDSLEINILDNNNPTILQTIEEAFRDAQFEFNSTTRLTMLH